MGSTVVLYCNITGENAATFSWLKYNGTTSYICSFGTSPGVCPSTYMTNFTYSNSVLVGTTLMIMNVGSGDFTTFACSGSSVAYLNLTELFTSNRFSKILNAYLELDLFLRQQPLQQLQQLQQPQRVPHRLQ